MEATMRLATEAPSRALPRRFRFTNAKLKSLKVPAGRDRIVVYDEAVPKLSYMLTDTGASAFYLLYKLNGRMRRYRIGDGNLPVETVRKLTAAPLAKIAQGIDPMDEKQSARAEQSFATVWDWYMRTHVRPNLRTATEAQQKYDLHLKRWAGRKFNTITRTEVARLHQQLSVTSPGSANRLVALLSSLYNRARDLGFSGENPARGVHRNPEGKRERYLRPAELPRFRKGLDAISEDMRDLFELALYSGARIGNVKSMEWIELDLGSAVWSIPGSKFKTGRPCTVPMVPQALTILRRRHRHRGDSPFVFPAGDSESGHIERPEKAWKLLCDTAGLDDLRTHDLRHSLASWQAANGTSLFVIGRGLGHVNTATTSRYAHIELDPVRVAMRRAVDAMSKAANGKARKGGGR